MIVGENSIIIDKLRFVQNILCSRYKAAKITALSSYRTYNMTEN